jgi:hypothetical protein
MKQGTGKSMVGSRKVEPRSKAVNVKKVADMGIHHIRTRPYTNMGEGFKAPMAKGSTHKTGSQGKH